MPVQVTNTLAESFFKKITSFYPEFGLSDWREPSGLPPSEKKPSVYLFSEPRNLFSAAPAVSSEKTAVLLPEPVCGNQPFSEQQGCPSWNSLVALEVFPVYAEFVFEKSVLFWENS